MSTTYTKLTTLIRYKGGVSEVVEDCSYHKRPSDGHLVVVGNRRQRQIARRHWLRQRDDYWYSGGGGSTTVTIRVPGKPAKNLERPRSSS